MHDVTAVFRACSYILDIIYVTVIVQTAAIVSDWFWLLFLVVRELISLRMR